MQALAKGEVRSLLETMPAKEAKRWFDCGGNHLGCRKDRGRITVRTKWQSGTVLGDGTVRRLRGNRPIGNEGCAAGKANPTYAVGLFSSVVTV